MKRRITISIDLNIIDVLDRKKGRVSRSRYINDILKESIESIRYYEGV